MPRPGTGLFVLAHIFLRTGALVSGWKQGQGREHHLEVIRGRCVSPIWRGISLGRRGSFQISDLGLYLLLIALQLLQDAQMFPASSTLHGLALLAL
jgi:hypothetical protein